MGNHVTKRTHPDLDWKIRPIGFWLTNDLLQSDAYRSLSKVNSDLLLFIMTRRKYPSKKFNNEKRDSFDYWSPLNGYEITIPMVAIKDFFSKSSMKRKAPAESTITRAFKKLMHVGFISLVRLGGSGKGDMSTYRLEHNWRVWKDKDPPCFTKAGMSRAKGFCIPGSTTFCPINNGKKLEKGSRPA